MRVTTRILVILVATVFGFTACGCSVDNANASTYPNPTQCAMMNSPAATDQSPPTVEAVLCKATCCDVGMAVANEARKTSNTPTVTTWTTAGSKAPTDATWAIENSFMGNNYAAWNSPPTLTSYLSEHVKRSSAMIAARACLILNSRMQGEVNADVGEYYGCNKSPATTSEYATAENLKGTKVARDWLINPTSNDAMTNGNSRDYGMVSESPPISVMTSAGGNKSSPVVAILTNKQTAAPTNLAESVPRGAPTSVTTAVTESKNTVEENPTWARGTPTTQMLAEQTAKKTIGQVRQA